MTRFILEGIVKLLDKFGLLDSFLGAIAKKMIGVFGGAAAGTAASGAGTAAGSAAGKVAGSAGGAAGSAGGALSSGVSALSGWITAISSAVSAVTGVIGVFQTAHMNNTLNAMERETARMAIYLGDQTGNSVQFYTGKTYEFLTYILHRLEGPILADLDAIKTSLWDIAKKAGAGAASVASAASVGVSVPSLSPAGAMSGGGSVSYNQFTITDPDIVKQANALVNSLKRAGMRFG